MSSHWKGWRDATGLPIRSTNVEQGAGHEPLAAQEAARHDGPVGVRVIAYRKRLADPDGICCKYLIDALVTCGVFEDDSHREINSVTTRQIKVKKGEEERTEVEIDG